MQRSAVHDVLRAPGRPLDEATRTDMEARLGADFSDVRLHSGPAARASAAGIGARAYTSGSHVVIGEGGADRHTLAHELTHVIQQRQGPVAGTDTGDGLRMSDPSDRFEREAEENARRVMSGPASVQREAVDMGRGPSAAGGGVAVQRTFKMVNKTYDAENAKELTVAMFDKAKGGQKRWTEDVKKTVVAKAQQLAEDEAPYGRFGNYGDLLDYMLRLVNQATAADLPAVAPGAVRTGSPEPVEPMEGVEPATQISDDQKISRLANFRRRASDVSTNKELLGFRDTTKIVSDFTYKHVPGNQYSIGHTGNFLLGGPTEHTYADLFAAVRTHTGLNDEELAARFVRALS
ncbi:eCIS core domain-containing protein, partial [Streptomyces eurythermus]